MNTKRHLLLLSLLLILGIRQGWAQNELNISSAAEFKAFADAVNAGTSYEGYTVNLTTDIDISEYCHPGEGMDLKVWDPIGKRTNWFQGILEGNGHTISGLYVYGMSDVGLFGYVNGATIRNLTVAGEVHVINNGESYYSGGIAGFITDGTIENCCNKTNITLGTGTVRGYNIGGIVGGIGPNATITGCCNLGNITVANSTHVGGIAGYMVSTSHISYCYNMGTVWTDENGVASGIIGWYPQGPYPTDCVSYCYNAGQVFPREKSSAFMTGATNDYLASTGIAVTDCCYDRQVSWSGQRTNHQGLSAKYTSEMIGSALRTGATGDGWTDEHWIFTDGMYPRINNGMAQDVAVMANATPVLFANNESANAVSNDFTVGTGINNNVLWTSEDEEVISISGNQASVLSSGEIELNASVGGTIYKKVKVSSGPCEMPTNLQVDVQGLYNIVVSWTSSVGSYELSLNYGAGIAVNSNSYTFTNLSIGTDYSVRVRAACGSGHYSLWTEPQTFHVDIPVPTGLYADAITYTSATMHCAAVEEASEYEMQYSTSPTFTAGQTTSYILQEPTKTITQLSIGTNYYYRFRVEYLHSELSEWSETASFQTKQIPAAPTGLQADNVSYGTATVTWNSLEQDDDFYSWDIKYGTTPDGSGFGTTIYTRDPLVNLNRLSAGTTYYFYVRRFVANGICTDWSEALSFTTLSSPVPSGLAVSDITQNSARVDWENIDEVNGWSVSFSTTAGDPDNGTIRSESNNYCQLYGLNPETTYYVYVRSYVIPSTGYLFYSEWSEVVNFRTFATPPAAPIVSNVTATGATITWEADNASEWNLRYRKDFENDWTVVNGIQTTSYALSGLRHSTQYDVQVQVSQQGEALSAWSGSVSFVTGYVYQTVDAEHPFSEDFEGNDNAFSIFNFYFNNKWCVGTAAANGGSKGLYVTNDDGADNAYTLTSSALVYAYAPVSLSGNYEISFDWKGRGESNCDFMRVAIVPENYQLSSNNSQISAYGLPSGWIAADGGVGQSENWSTKTVLLPNVPAGNYKLVFVWKNDINGGSNPPAAIDNVRLERVYLPPTGLQLNYIDYSSATLAWFAGGTESAWNVRYKKTSESEWIVLDNPVTQRYCTLGNLQDNTEYEAQVQAVMSDGVSPWTASLTFRTTLAPVVVSITNLAQLKTFRDGINSGQAFELAGKQILASGEDCTFNLAADIDLAQEDWTPIGTDAAPFKGTFDGCGHVIVGLNASLPTAYYQGLFGYVQNGTIQRLGVSGIVAGNGFAGGICGWLDEGSISYCYSMVRMLSSAPGICGSCVRSRVENCYCAGVPNDDTSMPIADLWTDSSTQNCYFDMQMWPYEYEMEGRCSTAELTSGALFNDTEHWVEVAGSYPRLVGGGVVAEALAAPVSLAAGQDVRAVCLGFSLGMSENVSWTASPAGIVTIGNDGQVSIMGNGQVVLSASLSGAVLKSMPLNVFYPAALWSGEGTETAPFVIEDTDDLVALMTYVASGGPTAGLNFALDGDLELSGGWTPIGSEEKPFEGAFDGNGYSISGLYIDNENDDNQGLFGYVRNGSISNLSVSGSVNGSCNVGGICGYLADGSITNCVSSVEILSSCYAAGGICGYYENSSRSVRGISYCISASNFFYESNSGIVGAVDGLGSVRYCYSIGNARGISNYWNVEGCYYDMQMTYGTSYGTPLLTNQMAGTALRTGETGEGWTDEHWTFTEGLYPRLKGMKNADEALALAAPIYLAGSENVMEVGSPFTVYHDGVTWETLDDSMALDLSDIANGNVGIVATGDEVLVAKINGVAYKTVNLSVIYFYDIASLSDLQALADGINSGEAFTLNGASIPAGAMTTCFRLTNDIDMSSVENWTPIGTTEHPFMGVLNGKGKTISNLTIVSENDNRGLFGVNAGRLTRLNLVNANVTGKDNVGALCGHNLIFKISEEEEMWGYISDCFVTGHATGAIVGGLCGKNENIIENSLALVKTHGVATDDRGYYLDFEMKSERGNGWNGASLDVIFNNNYNQSLTLQSGSSKTESVLVPNGTTVSLYWNGWDDTDFSFSVSRDGTVLGEYDFVDQFNLLSDFDYVRQEESTLVFDLMDSYGDGWSGNVLNVAVGENPIVQYTISSGSSESYELLVPANTHVSLSWQEGSWSSECSFTVSVKNGDVLNSYTHGTSMSTLSDFTYSASDGTATIYSTPSAFCGSNVSNIINCYYDERMCSASDNSANSIYPYAVEAGWTLIDDGYWEAAPGIYPRLANGTALAMPVEAYTPNVTTADGWHLIASPMTNDVVPSAINGLLGEDADLYGFDCSKTEEEWQNAKTIDGFVLQNGKGYLVANAETVPVVFTGTVRTDETVTIALTGEWNLVGNPLCKEATVNCDFYVLDENTHSELVPREAGSTVKPGEAIFVKNVASVTFTAVSQDW